MAPDDQRGGYSTVAARGRRRASTVSGGDSETTAGFAADLCSADASASIQRDEFGLTPGRDYGFNMEVVLRIQVEAIAAQ